MRNRWHCTVLLLAHVSTGGVVPNTVTVKLQVPDSQLVLYAVQCTVVVPAGNSEPESGEQYMVVGALFEHRLLAVTLKYTGVSEPVHAVTMLLGQKICMQLVLLLVQVLPKSCQIGRAHV